MNAVFFKAADGGSVVVVPFTGDNAGAALQTAVAAVYGSKYNAVWPYDDDTTVYDVRTPHYCESYGKWLGEARVAPLSQNIPIVVR